MKNLIFQKEHDGVLYYIYKPSIFHLYYNCYAKDDIPPYFSRVIHRIRMTRELFKSNYRIVYMEVNGTIVGHFVVGRGGSRIKMSKPQDIVIGPIWIIPEERSRGYGSKGINAILSKLDIEYEYAYEYIDQENIPSIRSVQKNGFEYVGNCREYGLLRIIKLSELGNIKLFRKLNPNNNAKDGGE